MSMMPSKPGTIAFHWGLIISAGVVLLLAMPGSVISFDSLPAVALIAAVVVLGLPHGALDAWLVWRVAVFRSVGQFTIFLCGYLCLAGLVVSLWWWNTSFALALFLAYSAWHFADDWRDGKGAAAPAPPLMGLAVIGLPAFFHPDIVAQLFSIIAGNEGAAVAAMLGWLGGLSMFFLSALAVFQFRHRRHRSIQIVLLVLLAWLTTPLLYFFIYFCFAHSVRHYSLVWTLADSGRRRPLLLSAGILTSVSVIIGAIAVSLMPPDMTIDDRLLSALFVGLAALTVPHLLVIEVCKRRHQQWAG